MSYAWLIMLVIRLIVTKGMEATDAAEHVAGDFGVSMDKLLELLPDHYL